MYDISCMMQEDDDMLEVVMIRIYFGYDVVGCCRCLVHVVLFHFDAFIRWTGDEYN